MGVRKISRLHQDLIAIIYKVADIINVKDVEYYVEFGSDEIDCFLSGLHKVNIKGVRDRAPVIIEIVIKWHENPSNRMCFRAAYQREYVFYQYIVPSMIQLQRRYKVIEGLKMKFHNCVYASTEYDRETIVVFLAKGYRTLNRFSEMNFAHSALVMKHLAKLHGLSFALENKCPEEFRVIRNLCSKDVQYSDPDNIPKSLIHYFNQALNVVSDPIAKLKLEAISPKISALLSKSTAPAPNYSTICHGDAWNNNILFKYQGNRPVDILFIDHQLVRYASPITDISYYLYMTTDQKLLSKHCQQLLNIYYGTLSAILRQCDLNVDTIYPKYVFEKHLRQYSVLGLIEALISMKIITAQSEEALKMTELKYLSSEDFIQYETQNHKLYIERVNGVVNDFFEKNYSLDLILT